MPSGTNQITLLGLLIQDMEIEYARSGAAIGRLQIAANENIIGYDGRPRALAWYHRATVFGKTAENLVSEAKAGRAIFVNGRLNFSSYETPAGEKRSSVDVTANSVRLMDMDLSGDNVITDRNEQGRLANGMNQVLLFGNLTRDPEVRYTPGGDAVANIGIAVNESILDRQTREWTEKPHYFNLTAWRDLALYAGEKLTRGTPVFAMGMLITESWEDKEGNRRYGQKIDVTRLEAGVPRHPGDKPTADSASQVVDIDEEFGREASLPF